MEYSFNAKKVKNGQQHSSVQLRPSSDVWPLRKSCWEPVCAWSDLPVGDKRVHEDHLSVSGLFSFFESN